MKQLLLLALVLAPAAMAQVRVTGAPVALTDAADGFAHPTFSPDGRFVALTTPGYTGLWVRDMQTGALQQLSDEVGAGFGATWAPDGQHVAARVARIEEDGSRRNAVRVFSVATGEGRLVRDFAAGPVALPQWSADGAALFVPQPGRPQKLATGLAPLSGKTGQTRPLVAGDALVDADGGAALAVPAAGQPILSAVFSPDGARVALHVMGKGLFVADADGRNLRLLGRGEHPTWSPDGRWIAFMRVEDDGHTLTGADLFAIGADGGGETRLTATRATTELYPTWTPDGAAIAFDDPDAGVVYLLPVAY